MVPRPLLAPRDTGPKPTPPKELVVCEEAGFTRRFARPFPYPRRWLAA